MSARPRVETHPPYVDTFGPEAVELCRRAGQQLDEWQQRAVELTLATRPDGKWACFEYCEWVSRQNGKGAILEARVLAGFLLLDERLILWSAHEYKTALEAFRRLKALLVGLGEQVNDTLIAVGEGAERIMIKVHNANGEEGFERTDTGQRIRMVARSKGSGRGFSGDLIILDEAFALTDVQLEALFFTLAARPNPQIIYTSSPPLTSDTGEVMFSLRDRGDPTIKRDGDDAEPWTQDDSLGYRDWGLAGDLDSLERVDLDSPELAQASNPALGIRITAETVRRERRAMTREGFGRERLGIWPRRVKTGAGVIADELWRALADAGASRPADVAFALHVNLARTWAAIAFSGMRDDGKAQVGLVDYREGTGWVVERLVELRERWNPITVAVDTRQEALLIELEKAGFTPPDDPELPQRGDLAIPTSTEVATAYGLFVDGVRDGRLRHLDEPALNAALAGAGTRGLAGGTAWDHKSSVEISPLVAVTLAHWAYEARAHLVTTEYDPLANIF